MERARHAWPDGCKGALSLSFDDARRSQVDLGLAILAQLDVAATFFVLPSGVNQDRRSWSEVVGAGHEVGNHTARHPCSANFAWSRRHAIEDLTLDDMAVEIDDADTWITQTFGVAPRTFAYPCGHTHVGRGSEARSFVPLVADRYLAARTFNDVAVNSPVYGDLAQVNAMCSDGLGLDQLLPILEATVDCGSWLVLGGHEVGRKPGDETTLETTLVGLVEWCRANGVWIDTLGNVAARVQAHQDAEQSEPVSHPSATA